MEDPATSTISKFKLEWDIKGLKRDIDRWKETIEHIDKKLEEGR